MRNKLLLLLSMAAVSVSASAGDWAEPSLKFSDPVSGDSVYIYNVEGQQFLTQGNAWGTQTSLGEEGRIFRLDYNESEDASTRGWTIMTCSGGNAGKYVFRDDTYAAYVDMASQGHNYWEITKQENGYYQIRTIAGDTKYGEGVRADGEGDDYYDPWTNEALGWDGGDNTTVNPGAELTNEDAGFDWQFVTLADYNHYALQLSLLETMEKAEAANVSTTAAEAVYNKADATDEEIRAAISDLKEAILNGGASQDDPVDATDYIQSHDFASGVTGWTIDIVNNQAGGGGYQTATYTNGDVKISGFIEAWTGDKSNGLGTGSITTVVNNLPAGLYRLGADIIACNQNGTAHTGVEFFAGETSMEVSTNNEAPEHFDLDFITAGGDVTIGLRLTSTIANWVAADNFTLLYMGKVDDPAKAALDQVISQCEALYPDMDAVIASKDAKEAYSQALEAAKGATSDFDTAKATLTDAKNALTASVKEYKTVKESLDDVQSKITQLSESESWSALVDQLADYYDTMNAKYEEGTLTDEEIASISAGVTSLIAQYISENCKAGDEVTILLNNPNFDKDASGWTTTGAGVTWLNYDGNGTNSSEAMASLETPQGGLAERWHNTFSMYQTIQNMPRGMYTLTCQGFNRHDDGEDAVSAELYAVLPDGSEQSVAFCDIDEYTTEEIIYNGGGTDVDRNGLWAPNSMSGAAWHFMNKKDGENYDYTNQFNIVMTEAGDLTVGARCEYYHQWVIFDNFRIFYQGTGANVYTPEIDRLITIAAAKGDEGILTQETEDIINQAINQGEDAKTGDSEQACLDAITALKAAIASADESIALIEQLTSDYDTYTSYLLMDVESSEPTYQDYLDEVEEAISNEEFESNAQVQGYIDGLKSGFTKFVQYDMLGSTEDNPGDISKVIYNTNSVDPVTQSTSTGGWTVVGGGVGMDGTSWEQYDKEESDFYQTIYGLAPGYYRVKVQGFYRAGFPNAVADSLNAGLDLQANCTLYAGQASTSFNSIMEDADIYNEYYPSDGSTVTIGDETLCLVNSMSQFAQAIELYRADDETPLYQNVLQFQVTEDQKETTIGIKRTGHLSGDWLIFTNWVLEYIGTAEPKTDPTTAVEAVEQAQTLGTRIYALDGTQQSRLTRGVNIIRTTLANGTVRTQKVLVR